jgi:hypothetical protein
MILQIINTISVPVALLLFLISFPFIVIFDAPVSITANDYDDDDATYWKLYEMKMKEEMKEEVKLQ